MPDSTSKAISVTLKEQGLLSMAQNLPFNQREPGRPLSALLSQVLVAFTVELDNQFEQ